MSLGSLRHGGGLQQHCAQTLLDRTQQLGFHLGHGWLYLFGDGTELRFRWCNSIWKFSSVGQKVFIWGWPPPYLRFGLFWRLDWAGCLVGYAGYWPTPNQFYLVIHSEADLDIWGQEHLWPRGWRDHPSCPLHKEKELFSTPGAFGSFFTSDDLTASCRGEGGFLSGRGLGGRCQASGHVPWKVKGLKRSLESERNEG